MLVLLLSLLIITSCNNKPDLYSYIVDRVWMNTKSKTQYYLSSNENREYFWLSSERRDGEYYYTFSNAEGTPETNPLPNTYTIYRQGWLESDFFKIEGDEIILQDEEDVNAENLSVFTLEQGADTTIGVFDYNTLIVVNKYGKRIWVSKIAIQ